MRKLHDDGRFIDEVLGPIVMLVFCAGPFVAIIVVGILAVLGVIK